MVQPHCAQPNTWLFSRHTGMCPRYGESSLENLSHEVQVRTSNAHELCFFFILFEQGSKCFLTALSARSRDALSQRKMRYTEGQGDQHQTQTINPQTWPPPLFLRVAICTFTWLLPETNRPSPPAVITAAFHSFLAEPWVRICVVSLQGGI